MKRFFKLAALSSAIFCATAANATLLIDDFSTDAFNISDSTLTGVVQHSTAVLSSNIIGGYRDVFIDKKVDNLDPSGGTGGQVSANVNTVGKTFSFNQDNDIGGTAILRWDGANSATAVDKTGLGGIMLSDVASGFEFTVKTDATAALPYYVKISVWDMSSNLSQFLFPATNTIGNYVAFYIDFMNVGWVGGANFNNVGALQVDFNIGASTRTDVDVGLRQVQAVPEPATLALVGAALLGLGAARRRKASK